MNSYKRFEAQSFAPTTRDVGRRQPHGVDALAASSRRRRRASSCAPARPTPSRTGRSRRCWPRSSRASRATLDPGEKGEGNLYGVGEPLPATLVDAVAGGAGRRDDRRDPRRRRGPRLQRDRARRVGGVLPRRHRLGPRALPAPGLMAATGARGTAASGHEPRGARGGRGVPGARGDLHAARAPLRARRRADRPARVPLGGRAGAARPRGAGDPRRRRRRASPAWRATSGRSSTPTARRPAATSSPRSPAALPEPAREPRHRAVLDDDEGVYCLPQRDVAPSAHGQLRTLGRPHALLPARGAAAGPAARHPARAAEPLRASTAAIPNIEGSTLFMPVSDVTRQCISALLLYFDGPHRYYIHDPRLGGDPLRPFVRAGLLDDDAPRRPVGLRALADGRHERRRAGARGQNLLLATQALGLGGHPVQRRQGPRDDGRRGAGTRIGGTGPSGSLGFTFHQVPADAPVGAGERIPVGLAGRVRGRRAAVPRRHGRRGRLRRRPALGPGGRLLDPGAPGDAVALARGRRARAAALGRGDRGDEGALPLRLGHVRPLPGDDRPVPDDRLVPGAPPGRRLLRPYYPPEALPEHVRTHMRRFHGTA